MAQRQQRSKALLSDIFSHVRDESITFEEKTHKYFIQWSENKKEVADTSVTAFVKRFFPKFNQKKILLNINRTKKTSKYFGMTDAQIQEQWEKKKKKSCENGTILHKNIENYYNNLSYDDKSYEFQLFRQFEKTLQLRPFRTEWMVRTDEQHELVGTIDMLYFAKKYNVLNKKTGLRELHLIMFDWKRCSKINTFSFNNEYGLGDSVCKNIRNCNYFHYSLQLNAYKYILEHFYHNMVVENQVYDNIQIDDMYLLVCHPDNDRAIDIPVVNYEETMGLMFEDQAKKIARKKNQEDKIENKKNADSKKRAFKPTKKDDNLKKRFKKSNF